MEGKSLEGEKFGGKKFGGYFWRFLRSKLSTFRVAGGGAARGSRWRVRSTSSARSTLGRVIARESVQELHGESEAPGAFRAPWSQ